MSLLTLLLGAGDSSQQATATAAVAHAVAPSATASVGGVTKTATAVASVWTVPSATAASTITIAATAATAHGVVPSATATVGGVTRSTTAVSAQWVAPAAAAAVGGVTRSTTAVASVWTVPAATATPTITATAAVAHCVVPSASAAVGGVTRSTTAVAAHWVTQSATATPGPRTVSVDQGGQGVSWWQTIAASIVIGAITATATAASANWVVPSATAGEGGSTELVLPFLSATSVCYAPTLPKVVLEVRENSTLRMTRDLALLDALATAGLTFTADERATIEDWTVLRASAIANGTVVELGWLRIEMPASGSTQALTLPTIASQEALYAPTMAHGGAGLQTLTLPTIASGAQLFAPSVPVYVVTFTSNQQTVFTKTVPMTSVHASEGIVFSEQDRAAVGNWSDLSASVTANGDQVEVSWLRLALPDAAPSDTIIGAFLASGAQLFPPSLGLMILEMPHIASTAVLHAPSIPQDGAYVQLLEGEIVRATWPVGLTSDWVTMPLTLTQTQWEAIGDWSVVRFAPVANGEQMQVSWARFVAPGQAPLALPLLASTVTFYPPTFEHGGTTMLAPIASTAVLYPPTLAAQAITTAATAASAVWTVPTATAAVGTAHTATMAFASWGVPAAAAAAGNTVRSATMAVAPWYVRRATAAAAQLTTATMAGAHWRVSGGRVIASVRVAYVSPSTRTVFVSPDQRRLEVGPDDRIVIVEEEP